MARPLDSDLLKFLKSKKAPGKLVAALSRSFIQLARQEIIETIQESTVIDESLVDLEGDVTEAWLPEVILSVLTASKAYESKFTDILNRMTTTDGKGATELQELFKKETLVSASTASKRDDIPNIAGTIRAQIDIKPGNSVEAQELFQLLKTTFYGGDYIPEIFKLDDGSETIMLNSTPGYNDRLVQAAADRLRDFFVVRYEDELGVKLKDELKEELKKFKSS